MEIEPGLLTVGSVSLHPVSENAGFDPSPGAGAITPWQYDNGATI